MVARNKLPAQSNIFLENYVLFNPHLFYFNILSRKKISNTSSEQQHFTSFWNDKKKTQLYLKQQINEHRGV